jgi:quercetin dioxygenase-like cupin family protein
MKPLEIKQPKTSYEKWVLEEGVPYYKECCVEDLRAVPLAPWKRKGGDAALINLADQQINNAYICEIAPGGELKPQRQLFEEIVLIVSGRGATSIWTERTKKQTFEWQEGSLFAVPLNAWHQHFNGQGDKPVRYIAVTSAPSVINLFHNIDFVFHAPFEFTDRYAGEEDYFSGKGRDIGTHARETNFVADVRRYELKTIEERGKGAQNIGFELAENTMSAFISQWPVGTYKKAHRHGPGAHIVILSGSGYSLMWREGAPIQRFDWKPWSLLGPYDMWFHQHFNTSGESVRFLAMRWGSVKYGTGQNAEGVATSVKEGGNQIEYEDEDPEVREMFEDALKKNGMESQMPPRQAA